jgi:hypothetical protein
MNDPTYNTVAQFAHVGMAYAITLSVLLIGNGAVLYWYLPVAVGLAAAKEFWYDYKFESPEVRGSSLVDFTFYLVGISAATIFWMLIGGYR